MHCSKIYLNSKSLNGHLAQCRMARSGALFFTRPTMEALHQPPDDEVQVNDNETPTYDEDNDDYDNEIPDSLPNVSLLLFQKLLLEKLKLKELSLGKVKCLDKKYSKPEFLTYLDICDTLVCKIGGLSESDSTEIMLLIKRASNRHDGSEEVPLPSRYF
jgi:hypothetical protein